MLIFVVPFLAATGNKRLTQLLHDSPDGLEEDCPYTSQALVAAVLNDCHTNVAILANFCTDLAKIDNALHFARNLGKYKSHATLLLIKAVLLRDRLAIEVLFGEHDRPAKLRAGTAPSLQTTPSRESPLPRCRSAFSFSTSRSSSQEWSFVATPSPIMTMPTQDTLQCEENLVPVVGALATNQVSAAVALPSAMRNVDLPTMGELLWRVGVDRKQGEVAWFDLGLPMLSQEWLYRIRWVRTLNLAHNKLRNLADDMHLFLTKVWMGLCRPMPGVCILCALDGRGYKWWGRRRRKNNNQGGVIRAVTKRSKWITIEGAVSIHLWDFNFPQQKWAYVSIDREVSTEECSSKAV